MPTPLKEYKTWIKYVDDYWKPTLENDPNCDDSCIDLYNSKINEFITLCDNLVAPKMYSDAILMMQQVHDLKYNTDIYSRYPDLPSVDDLFDDFIQIIPMTFYELTDDIESLFAVVLNDTTNTYYLDTTNFDNIITDIQTAQNNAGEKITNFLQKAGGRIHDIMMSVVFGNLKYQEKSIKKEFDKNKYFKLGRLETYYPYVLK